MYLNTKLYSVLLFKKYPFFLLALLCSSFLVQAQCPTLIAADPSTQCSGQPITFTIADAQAGATYVWAFGDGQEEVSTSTTITHTYELTGTTPVTRTVTVQSTSCPAITKEVIIKPQVAFSTPSITYTSDNTSSSGTTVCVPNDQDTISITATLTNTQTETSGIASYTVDWGNGETRTYTPAEFSGTATISNPTPYDEEGDYPITITANSTDPATTCSTSATIPFNVGKEPKASFTSEKTEIIQPAIDCGVPVRVELTNESTGGNLTYLWEVESNGQPATDYEFIEGTNETSEEPVLKFNKEGRYTIRLRVSNPCVDPDNPDGPIDEDDPNDPNDDFDEDGKYVYEEQVIIVYPQANIQSASFCEEVPGQPVTLTGADLGVNFDANTELTVQEGSILWTVTGGATIVGGNTENPTITFPGPGTYNVSASFRNECFSSEDLQPATPAATITIQALPSKARNGEVTICEGEDYKITPGTANQTFNFYTTPSGGTPVNATPAASLPATGLTTTTTYYVAAVNENCENNDRSTFIVNVIPSIENNIIELAPNQSQVCQGQTISNPITGSLPEGGNGSSPLYVWQQSTSGDENSFTTAPGTNNSRNYTPPALTQATWFRRLVTIGSCAPDTSNIVMITVTPPITNNTLNNISGSQNIICEGEEAPEITGSQPATGAIISWESSTTSATATDFVPATGINNEANFSPGALAQTTWFRRRLTVGGCTDVTAAVEITVTPALDPTTNTITGDQTYCSTNTAPAQLTGSAPSGGNVTPVYQWQISLTGNDADFGPAPGTNTGQNYTPPALTQTTWFRRSVTAGNCDPVYSNNVSITVVPTIADNTITATQTTVCRGSNATLTGSTPTGGSGTPVYLWESSTTSATAGFNPAIGTNNEINYTPATIVQPMWFRRTVTSSGTDCPPVASNVVAITIEELPAVPVVEAPAVRTCAGSSATLRVTSTGANYEWYTEETGGTPVSYDRVFITPPLTSDIIYYVQAISQNQCVSASRTPVRVTVTPFAANAGRDTTIIEGQTYGLQATGGTQYVWTPAEGLNNSTIPNPVARPTRTTTYTVTVTTEDGCTDTDEVTITVMPRVTVLNTFSPNRDGINETWEIQNIENYPEATVEIFNRWGNQVFKSEGTYQPWDGTYKGSVLPLATYYYIIRLNKDEKPLTGSVTIIR
ncbi:MAG: hypothetical protein COW65_03765 [Cytophagales bacterium CG18_big_fil_WC_8_21_14_2_50_42_9]|nr:MAG: hypothetical protein COW65_03765 [Cytophagales bacterium CG18_big_fil_WC_8_21_14_2_50_42_9]